MHQTCIMCVSYVHHVYKTCACGHHVHVSITRVCVHQTCIMCVSHVHACTTRVLWLYNTCMRASHVHVCIKRVSGVYHTCIMSASHVQVCIPRVIFCVLRTCNTQIHLTDVVNIMLFFLQLFLKLQFQLHT